VIVLPYDVATAKIFGQIRARREETGNIRPDAAIQIAATAIYHDKKNSKPGALRHVIIEGIE
jgi:predicted nucleic acid-binding protein